MVTVDDLKRDAPVWATSHSVFRPDLFEGQTVIVTGGGSGQGAVIADQFAAHGANVAIASRGKIGDLDKTSEELTNKYGRAVLAVPTNIREYDEVLNLFEATKERFGRIHIVVNNAGGQFACRFEDITVNGWKSVIDLNLNGTFHMCKAATEHMKDEGGGAIINIVNDYCFNRGAPEFAHSGASRSGVINLTQTLALEMAPYNITVNVLSPGSVRTTGIVNNYGDDGKFGDWLERDVERIPLGRWAEPEEVAQFVLYFASHAADYVTGQDIRIDGGGFLGNLEFAWPDKMKYGDRSNHSD
jgi:NAD(P)-dependent dehydrogenase (short-subunit alcohol dehydrogenase family)